MENREYFCLVIYSKNGLEGQAIYQNKRDLITILTERVIQQRLSPV